MNLPDGKYTGTTWTERWVYENKDKRLIQPKHWNLWSAIKAFIKRLIK